MLRFNIHQRNTFIHSLTTKIINENQVIVLENLSIKKMLKNHKLAQSISDVSWYKFKEQLKYKSEWYNRDLVLVDRYFPSTQLCSSCGNKQKLSLSDRVYKCSCGLILDRDYNASLNILNEGKRLLNISGSRLYQNNSLTSV